MLTMKENIKTNLLAKFMLILCLLHIHIWKLIIILGNRDKEIRKIYGCKICHKIKVRKYKF